MGQLPSVEYVAAESVPKIIGDLQSAGISLHHLRGTVHDGAFGQEWDCRWRHVRRWLSFVVDSQTSGQMFVCLGHEPWYWWLFRRSEHCEIDDMIDATVQRYAIQRQCGR